MKIESTCPEIADPEITVACTLKRSEWTVLDKMFWYTSTIPEMVRKDAKLPIEEFEMIKNYMKEMHVHLRDKVNG